MAHTHGGGRRRWHDARRTGARLVDRNDEKRDDRGVFEWNPQIGEGCCVSYSPIFRKVWK